jgi:hypothetical protein
MLSPACSIHQTKRFVNIHGNPQDRHWRTDSILRIASLALHNKKKNEICSAFQENLRHGASQLDASCHRIRIARARLKFGEAKMFLPDT